MQTFDPKEIENFNLKIKEKIENILKEKYQEDFIVKTIGKRFGTSDNNTVTAFCVPEEDESLLFSAVINIDNILLEDTYHARKICRQVEATIEKKFNQENISACSKVCMTETLAFEGDTETEQLKNTSSCFISNTIIDKTVDKNTLEKIIHGINNEFNNIDIIFNIYIIDNEGEYQQYQEKMLTRPMVSKTFFNNSKRNEKIRIALSKNNITY